MKLHRSGHASETGAPKTGGAKSAVSKGPADPLVRLAASLDFVGPGLAAKLSAGMPPSSTQLSDVLYLLPKYPEQTRVELYELLRECHHLLGSQVEALATPGEVSVGVLLEVLATPAVPKTAEAAAAAIARNDETLQSASKDQLEVLTARKSRLAQYADALTRPVVATSEAWQVAADTAGRELAGVEKQLKKQPGDVTLLARRDELTAARDRLLARQAVESDPTRQLASVPVLGARMVELAGGGRLEASEVTAFLGTDVSRGLADLAPPQRKALLKTLGAVMGEDLLPPALLKVISRPVTSKRIIESLSSGERFPATRDALAAALTDAKGKLQAAKQALDAVLKDGAPDALPMAEQKTFAELKTQHAYSAARADELAARLTQLEQGLPAMPVQSWPTNVADAAAAVGGLQTQLGAKREDLIIERDPKVKARLEGELQVLSAQKRTLELLHGELSKIPTLNAWQKTGIIAAVNAQPVRVPGLFSLWGSAGVMRDPADRLTQKNAMRPYVAAGVSTPVAGLGGMYSKTVKGFQGEVNPVPMVSVGRNPLLGDFVGVCIPCVVAVTVSSNGTLGLTRYRGLIGGRLFLRNEAFAHVTQPLTEALLAGYSAGAKLIAPIVRPVQDMLRPVSRAVKSGVQKVKDALGKGNEEPVS